VFADVVVSRHAVSDNTLLFSAEFEKLDLNAFCDKPLA